MPIDAAVGANVLSGSAVALASADQDSLLTQHLQADALANAEQSTVLDQSRDDIQAVEPVEADPGAPAPTGALLDLNADLDLNLDLAAPIDAAIAANANVGAPIDAAVSANVLSGGAQAIATAPQDSVIVQSLEGTAIANAAQDAYIDQSDLDAEGIPADAVDLTAGAAPAADTLSVDTAPADTGRRGGSHRRRRRGDRGTAGTRRPGFAGGPAGLVSQCWRCPCPRHTHRLGVWGPPTGWPPHPPTRPDDRAGSRCRPPPRRSRAWPPDSS